MEDIKKAKQLLIDNGYIIRKLTKTMELDCAKCEQMQNEGKDMDCSECSCSLCIVQ